MNAPPLFPERHHNLVAEALRLPVGILDVYWLLARTWVKRSVMPPAGAVTYRVLRAASAVLLAAGLVGVVLWWPGQAIVAGS